MGRKLRQPTMWMRRELEELCKYLDAEYGHCSATERRAVALGWLLGAAGIVGPEYEVFSKRIARE